MLRIDASIIIASLGFLIRELILRRVDAVLIQNAKMAVADVPSFPSISQLTYSFSNSIIENTTNTVYGSPYRPATLF